MNKFFLFLALLLFVPNCIVAQELPYDPADVFAPGIITKDSATIYRGSFTPSGNKLYFFRKMMPQGHDYKIFVSHLGNGNWTEPKIVKLGGDFSNLYPSISPDGKRMVFTSYRPAPGDTVNYYTNANLWYVDWQQDRWGKPVFMEEASTLANYDSGPRFMANGDIEFVSTSPDWSTRYPRLVSWDGEKYTNVRKNNFLDPWKNWKPNKYFLWEGTLSPKGNIMILGVSEIDQANNRAKPSDHWYSKRTSDGSWTAPKPLRGNVNSEPYYENFTVFSPDGEYLYFVRDFKKYFRVSVDDVIE